MLGVRNTAHCFHFAANALGGAVTLLRLIGRTQHLMQDGVVTIATKANRLTV